MNLLQPFPARTTDSVAAEVAWQVGADALPRRAAPAAAESGGTPAGSAKSDDCHLAERRRSGALPGGVIVAEVYHKRLRPRVNAFRYRVSYLCLPLSRLDEIDGRWLRLDRAGPVSIHRRDHGDGGDPRGWISDLLRRWHLDRVCDGEVTLITLPRLFGYVFNPVSFWCCQDAGGGLRAVLCEVRNTFGERHNYLVCHDDHRPIAPGDWLGARKLFHVSPFMPVDGHYRFRFRLDADRVSVTIDYHDKDGPILLTGIAGRRAPLDDRAVVRRFLCNPLMTLAVIFRIHWQAARLWLRRTPFFVKPDPPMDETTR